VNFQQVVVHSVENWEADVAKQKLISGDRMDYHHHARLTIYSRGQLAKSVVEGRLSLREAAAERGLSRQSASKWVRRYRASGAAGLADRSSRPHRSPRQTSAAVVERVGQLRQERKTGVQIAQLTGLSRPTVSRILTRLRLNKIRMLEPKLPPNRYERDRPGDLLHIDIKKLARIHKPGHRITGNPQDETRGAGWEFLYVAVDDHSRMAYVAMMPDEKAITASLFLSQAAAYFARHNIQLRRVMTDNGPCFISDRFKAQCHALKARHIRTRIYTPRTNGKAERFIQTAIREWAYARLYQNSQERNSYLPIWIHKYNWHRPHASLNQMPPITRSGLDIDVNNLLRHDI
jgi:transposase InsO family protein